MKRIIFVTFLVLTALSCTTDPGCFEEYTRYKVMSFEIGQVVDNGCYIDEIYLEPQEYSEDRFYVIESPDLLDSVFISIEYKNSNIPRLENLFPDDGVLLVYDGYLVFSKSYEEHSLGFNADSVLLNYTLEDIGPGDPGLYPMVFPIGVVPSR